MMNAQSEVLRQRVTDRLQAIYKSVGPEKQDAAEAEFNSWFEQRLQSGVNADIEDSQSSATRAPWFRRCHIPTHAQ